MIKTIFWRGIKATVPLLITFAVVIWLFQIIETFFGSIIKDTIGPQYYFKGLGCILGIIFIFCVGLVVNFWLVQWFYGIGERLVKRIPLIKTIYNSLADLLGFFDPAKKGQSGKPVLINTALGKVIGFITIEGRDSLPEDIQDESLIAVYIPLSYQIGGITVFIPKSQTEPMKMAVDKAMSFVLTAGMTGQR